MLGELETSSERRDEIEEAIETETASDKSPHRRATMLRAVSLAGRAATLVDLTGTLKTLVGLDRQAFNLDASGAPATGDGAAANAVHIPADPIEASRVYQRLINGGA